MSLNAYHRFKEAMNLTNAKKEEEFTNYLDGDCPDIIKQLNPELWNLIQEQTIKDFKMERFGKENVTIIGYHVLYACEDTEHHYEQWFVIDNERQNVLVKITDQQTKNTALRIFDKDNFFDEHSAGQNYPFSLENEETKIEFPSSKSSCNSTFSQTRHNGRVITENYEQGTPLSVAFTSEDAILNACNEGTMRIFYNSEGRVSRIQLVTPTAQSHGPFESLNYHSDCWFTAQIIATRIGDEIKEICRIIDKNVNNPSRSLNKTY